MEGVKKSSTKQPFSTFFLPQINSWNQLHGTENPCLHEFIGVSGRLPPTLVVRVQNATLTDTHNEHWCATELSMGGQSAAAQGTCNNLKRNPKSPWTLLRESINNPSMNVAARSDLKTFGYQHKGGGVMGKIWEDLCWNEWFGYRYIK